jgi:cytochrome c-type biogenesis protein CcmE
MACSVADQVLAKHDENYMAPEAAEALERARASQALAPADASSSQVARP